MASITFRHVQKTYEGAKAPVVPDLNLEIKDKEFVILVGPSGCGKSTTLRMIAGLESVTSGDLLIGDRKVNSIPPKDRDIAMVFQNYALYPHMTVYQNIAFGLSLRKVSREETDRRVREVAKMLGLEELLQRKPKALSGGQRQRVALGRAMVRHPAVFLLDEPLSNLDAKLRTSMRSEISRLHKQLDTTFVYVTHDQTEAMTMADRIVVMKAGVIQQVDTPQALYDRPDNLFVAGFIGSPQMNFVPAEILKEGEKLYALVEGGRPESFLSLDRLTEDNSLKADVDLRELLGAEYNVYLKIGDTGLVMRMPAGEQIPEKGTLRIPVDTGKMHFFDPATERAICH